MINFFKKCLPVTTKNSQESEITKSAEKFMSTEAILAAEMSIANLHSELCESARLILKGALVDMRHIYSFRKLEDGGGTIIDEAGRIKCNQITVGSILYALAIHDYNENDTKGIPSINSKVLAYVQLHPSDSAQELREKIGYLALEEKSLCFFGEFSNDPNIAEQINIDLTNDPKAIVKWPIKSSNVTHDLVFTPSMRK